MTQSSRLAPDIVQKVRTYWLSITFIVISFIPILTFGASLLGLGNSLFEMASFLGVNLPRTKNVEAELLLNFDAEFSSNFLSSYVSSFISSLLSPFIFFLFILFGHRLLFRHVDDFAGADAETSVFKRIVAFGLLLIFAIGIFCIIAYFPVIGKGTYRLIITELAIVIFMGLFSNLVSLLVLAVTLMISGRKIN